MHRHTRRGGVLAISVARRVITRGNAGRPTNLQFHWKSPRPTGAAARVSTVCRPLTAADVSPPSASTLTVRSRRLWRAHHMKTTRHVATDIFSNSSLTSPQEVRTFLSRNWRGLTPAELDVAASLAFAVAGTASSEIVAIIAMHADRQSENNPNLRRDAVKGVTRWANAYHNYSRGLDRVVATTDGVVPGSGDAEVSGVGGNDSTETREPTVPREPTPPRRVMLRNLEADVTGSLSDVPPDQGNRRTRRAFDAFGGRIISAPDAPSCVDPRQRSGEKPRSATATTARELRGTVEG